HAPVLPGQWLSITLPTATRQALTVPVAAIVMHGAQSLVYRDEAGRAQPVPVRVLGVEDGYARIRGALRSGDTVVLSGNTRLRAGTPLEVRE
ncbi:MAG: efflux RND transporter periplasmic adaptor subunit, partial [Acidithiobacillus sp.]